MYRPDNFFDEYHAERLLRMGIKTKFAEYIIFKQQKKEQCLNELNASLNGIPLPPRIRRWLSATVITAMAEYKARLYCK